MNLKERIASLSVPLALVTGVIFFWITNHALTSDANWDWFPALIMAVVAFVIAAVGIWLIANNIVDTGTLDAADDLILVDQMSQSVKSMIRSAGKLDLKVAEQLQDLIGYVGSTINDFRDPAKMDKVKLNEFQDDLSDFTDSLGGYLKVFKGELTVSNRGNYLKSFEANLPSYVRGFQSFAEEVDQAEVARAELKQNLLKDKLAARGRIDTK